MNDVKVNVNQHAVSLHDVVVSYPFEMNRATSLKEYAIRILKRDMRTSFLKALDGVTVDIQPGETFGIIGRNGAGKSTMLKVISRIIHPTSGRLKVWGKVASLLGVGAGFHPELSGKENIFLYSALLGRSQSYAKRKFNEIVTFAELGDFIDAPLRTYSTGMVARLGFAVAMADRPDILLVDEVLGVGDTLFQRKCTARFDEFRDLGTTLILVSHNLPQVAQICETAMWLHQGVMKSYGEATKVVAEYEMHQQRH